MLILAGAVLGCDAGEAADLKAKLHTSERELSQLRHVSSEREQLYGEVMDAARFVNNIQRELSSARARSGRRIPAKQLNPEAIERPNRSRAELLADVHEVLAHLDSVERRVTTLEASSSSRTAMKAQLESLRSTIASVRAAAIDQQAQVETLSTELAKTRKERDNLADQVLGLQDAENTVFVLARPIAQLLELGVLVEEGGRRGILGLGGKRGSTFVPGRDLHEADFTPLSRMADQILTLPHPDRRYAIASRHNGQLLSPSPAADGTIPGRVKILDSVRFWANSRFLILIER
jgi:hypothetical protein